MRSEEELLALTRSKAGAILARQRKARGLLGVAIASAVLIGAVSVAARAGGEHSNLQTTDDGTTTTAVTPPTSAVGEPTSIAETTSTTAEATTTTSPPVTTPPPPTSTEVNSGGVTLTMTAAVVSPTTVQVTLRVRDTDGSLRSSIVAWGDGFDDPPYYSLDCDLATTTTSSIPPAPAPSDETVTHEHVYRVGGHYTLTASVRSRPDDCAKYESAQASLTVDVPEGTGFSNGPASPETWLTPFIATGGDPNRVYASAEAYDDDGWVFRLEVDWGDGSPPSVVDGGFADCSDNQGATYPRGTSARVDPATNYHDYADSSPYTITLTARSAGCGGGDVQTATATAPRS